MTSRARMIGWAMTSCTLLAALVAACGGNVVVDVEGAGGAGAGPSTSTTTTTTYASVTASAGGVTSVSSTSFSAVSTATVSTATVSTGSGPSECDNNPEGCGENGGGGCVECAQAGPCRIAVDDCTASMACIGFLDCLQSCPNGSCFEQCAAENVEGVRLYQAIITCIFCDACRNDCGSLFPMGCGGAPDGDSPRP